MIVKRVDDLIMCEALYNVTTRCNCRCKHCNPKVYTGKAHEISSKEMIERFEKSKYLQGNTYNIAGGEPFLKDDLEDFVLYLNEKGIPCVIATNGWFTEKIIHLVEQIQKKELIRFAISIDGTEERHEEIRRCKGIYQRAIQSVKALKERGVNVQVNTVVQKDSLQSLDEFDLIFKNMGVPVEYIPEVFVSDREFNFTTEDIKKAFKYITYPRGRKYLLSKGKYAITNCHAGINSWYIDSNGDIYACWGSYYRDDSDKYILGNLFEQDFDTIFESQKKKDICNNIVKNCSGCLLPCDLVREVEVFGMSTSYTKEEVAVLADELSSCSNLDDFSVDESEWNLLETDKNNASFRWMKSKVARVFLNVRSEKTNRIVIDYMNIRPNRKGDFPLNLQVDIDGQEIGKAVCKPGRNKIHFRIPKKMNVKGLVEIGLHINSLWSPSEYTDSSDSRKLGIAVYSVSFD